MNPNRTPDLAKDLNPPQQEAVRHMRGPMLILAGAGSGKTRVLTFRAAQLILNGEASPDEILAVTFTNKAAREMEDRIHKLLSEVGIPVHHPLWISTFHSTCARILRDQIHLLDYQPYFVIYDDSDQLSLIKKIMDQLGINDKVYPPKSFRSKINEAKMLALGPSEVMTKAHYLMDQKSLEVYERYETEMKRANALDFGDLLYKTYELFRMYPDVLEAYQDKFRFIMVDEYQDTNRIQYLIVKMLAEKHKNLCVVGDEDQSIYSWRGADISNILNFEADFPNCKVIKLEQNYRSTANIVEAATHLIKNNSQRKDKTLFTANGSGSPIVVREERNDYEEARYVVEKIEQMRRENPYSFNDFAVFYRTNAQSRVLEDQLRSHSIPYRIVGGLKFYERMEIKDLLAYMKIVLNPADDIAVGRIINVPARGIGKTTVDKLVELGGQRGLTLFEAILRGAEERVVHSGAAKKLVHFRALLDRLREHRSEMASQIFMKILEETQYVERLKQENNPESQARIDNIEEFHNAILQFEQERGEEASLQSFLEEMALVSDVDNMDESQDCVTLMTLHISKGLEYPNVFIVGMEEGLFPGARSFESSDPTAVEEERRLAYVGMTRARENLFLVYARTRRVWGQEHSHPPSRFLNEIPSQYLKQESALSRPQFLDRYASRLEDKFSARSGFQDRADRRSSGVSAHHDYEDEVQEFADEGSDFKKGMRVRHPTFGLGSIYQVEGSGEGQKVSVLFHDQTLKKFVTKYARLQRA